MKLNLNSIIFLIASAVPIAFCSVCRPVSIQACYDSRAMGLLRDLVKPPFGEIEQDSSMERTCARRLSLTSHCVSLVKDCPLDHQQNLTYLEDAYKVLRSVVCTEVSFQGLHRLWDCVDRPRRKKCDYSEDVLHSPVIGDHIHQCAIAQNYRWCLADVTSDISSNCEEGKIALEQIVAAVVDITCGPLRELQSTLSTSPTISAEENNSVTSLGTSAESGSPSSSSAQGYTPPSVQEKLSDTFEGITNSNVTAMRYGPTTEFTPSSYTTPSKSLKLEGNSVINASVSADEGISANASLHIEENTTGENVRNNCIKAKGSQGSSTASKFIIGVLVPLLYIACFICNLL